MKRFLIGFIVTILSCIVVYANGENKIRDVKSLSDQEFLETIKQLYLDKQDENNRLMDNVKSEFWHRLSSTTDTKNLEILILKEMEFKKCWFTENEQRRFQNFCRSCLDLMKTDEAFDEMIALLERGNVLKDAMIAVDIIKQIGLHKYTKAIPTLEKLGFVPQIDSNRDIKDTALRALAIIGKPGVDALIERLEEVEKENETNNDYSHMGIFMALMYSRDSRALDIAYRYLLSPKTRSSALLVLGGLGAKLPSQMKNNFNEEFLRDAAACGFDVPFAFFLGIPDISEEERCKIKEILLDTLRDEHEKESLKTNAANALRYFPYSDVYSALQKTMNDDPNIRKNVFSPTKEDPNRTKDVYVVRDEAKKSLSFMKDGYPELFNKMN